MYTFVIHRRSINQQTEPLYKLQAIG